MSDFIDQSSAPPAVSEKVAEDKAVVKEEVVADMAAATSPAAPSSNWNANVIMWVVYEMTTFPLIESDLE